MSTISIPEPRAIHYLPADFTVDSWDNLLPFYEELRDRSLDSVEALVQWLRDRSELEAVVSEAFSRCYIGITVDTQDEKAAKQYQHAVQELIPKIAPFENLLNEKILACSFIEDLDPAVYHIYLRGIKKDAALFREENIPVETEIQMKKKRFGELFSQMLIEHDGQQITLQKAGTFLEETDRTVRETIYHKINQRLLQDTDNLEELYDALVQLRHQLAQNAGFDNYRDYKFQSLGRFDYSPEDCFNFHDAIQSEIVPIVNWLNEVRQEKLGLDTLRPWDLAVDWSGEAPLRPFQTVDELVEKTTACLGQLHPYFGECLAIMEKMGHLDLDSRKGKSPGGYNMPLHLSGVPFIFMNASRSLNDLRTLLHESGHAVHSFLTRDYELNSTKQPTPEIAELASMTMELLTLDHLDFFFKDPAQLKRAKIAQLEGVLKTLPWTATIDHFQHWAYTHPTHSRGERKSAWLEILHRYTSDQVDRTGLEQYSEYQWHRQLHVFEVPFYYIEYGMAQLGAVAIWKRYREEPEQALKDYIEALKLGYSKPIGAIYEAAGIQFDFSREYVAELAAFVQQELKDLLEV